MRQALSLARSAGSVNEVPVGAIIVQNEKIISSGINLREKGSKTLAHAELLAIDKANIILGKWRLSQAVLYVTLEPCLMCAGALVQSRIARVVYGAKDPKGGALGSLYALNDDPRLNHKFEVSGGVLEKDCSEILKEFFKARR